MKGPPREKKSTREKESTRELKANKSIYLNTWLERNEQSMEEFKAACKTRKRKERQESVSSTCQERKFIRSNSEERPHSKKQLEKENIIRRVLSSEDIRKRNTKNKKNDSPKAKSEGSETTSSFIDDEHEKRRWVERFSKPLTLKFKKSNSKKPKGRGFFKSKHKVDDKHAHYETTTVEIEIHSNGEKAGFKTFDEDESPSPSKLSSSPAIDLSTLHQQVDDSDPLPSCSKRVEDEASSPSLSVVPNRLLSSPRNSIIAAHCIYLDQDIYNNFKKTVDSNEEKLQRVSRRLQKVKRKLKRYENEFQLKHGHKPNHYNKINDVKKYCLELLKLKREYKQLKYTKLFDPATSSKLKEKYENNHTSEDYLVDLLFEIEMKLQAERDVAKRSFVVEDLTLDELLEEKASLQKALLHLQDVYGRPTSKNDRDLVRPLYDRYRLLKKMIKTMDAAASKDLQTIIEDETANFDAKSSSDTSSETISVIGTVSESETDVSVNENLHEMSRFQLEQLLLKTRDERILVSCSIKEYEASVEEKTGRKIQKEEKLQIEPLYKNNKTLKSKLRLLEALLAKHT